MIENIFYLERRKLFEAKRKGHYQEWHAVQMARRLLAQDELEEEDEDDEGKNEENSSEEETFDTQFKCMPSCDRIEKK